MTEYYAMYPYRENELDYCRHLCRFVDDVPERYDKEKDDWVFDATVLAIYMGDPPCDEITEEQAQYVIRRIKSGEAEELAYESWRKAKGTV